MAFLAFSSQQAAQRAVAGLRQRPGCRRASMVSASSAPPPASLPPPGVGITDEDRRYMRRAVELAATAKGQTQPNPCVGSVVVKDGVVVGEGYHPKAGLPHAEVYALRGAGPRAEGAVAYVSLEPCNHYGRTPPCSRALVAARVRRVVVGMVDPNPLVFSEGIRTLLDAGIEVQLMDGAEAAACEALNLDFIARMRAQSVMS